MQESTGKGTGKNGSFGEKKRPPPALDPESPRLVQPYQSFIDHGWMTISVSFEAGKLITQVNVIIPGSSPVPVPTAVLAKEKIIEAKLWTPRDRKVKGGPEKKDPLPRSSLCVKDMDLDENELKSRIAEVAKAIGSDTARGRIGSLRMAKADCETFDQWWSDATPPEKVRLLSDGKHHKLFTRAHFVKLQPLLVKAPFRGSVPLPPKEEEDEEDKEEQKSPARGSPKPT